MPVYKDNERNTWYVKCYYEDWNGQRKQKKKRGFTTKREAKKWEDEFLVIHAHRPDIKMDKLIEEYMKDVSKKVRQGTYRAKENCLNNYVLPYFKDVPASEISPEALRVWQNNLCGKPKIKGTGTISSQYIHLIKIHLSAVFTFGVKYFNLPSNPMFKVDKIEAECDTPNLNFWEYNEFLKAIKYEDDIMYKLIIETLFFSGMRIGEFYALCPSDFCDADQSVSITKSLNYTKGGTAYGPPKSKNGTRKVTLPDFLYEDLKQYIYLNYITENDRIFTVNVLRIREHLDILADKASVPHIRIHDLRHSHVSYLISLGFSITEIADRIGDTAKVVSDTYAHLYPEARKVIAKTLSIKSKSDNLSVF